MLWRQGLGSTSWGGGVWGEVEVRCEVVDVDVLRWRGHRHPRRQVGRQRWGRCLSNTCQRRRYCGVLLSMSPYQEAQRRDLQHHAGVSQRQQWQIQKPSRCLGPALVCKETKYRLLPTKCTRGATTARCFVISRLFPTLGFARRGPHFLEQQLRAQRLHIVGDELVPVNLICNLLVKMFHVVC